MQDYLCLQQRRLVTRSEWTNIFLGKSFSRCSLRLCIRSIFVLDLYIPEGIKSIRKLFADDTLPSSIVKKDKLSQDNLNSDLKEKKKKYIRSSVENAF